MQRRLPPLNWLKTFEAAARHLSFTKAGAELNMSQAAVSQRVKALEDYLGSALFYRHNRALTLTEVAKAYLPSVRASLDQLDTVTEQLFARRDSSVLTVRATAGFAALWLAPRLIRFHKQHPDIDLRLITADSIEDQPMGPDFDAEIRYGSGRWTGLRADKLMDVEIFPVCAPDLAAELQEPDDLRRHSLIHVIGYQEDWPMWLKGAKAADVESSRGIQVDATLTALEAAREGAGIALGRTPLVNRQLDSGRLVRPFPERVMTGKAYYLIGSAAQSSRPDFAAFRAWLLSEIS